MPIPHSAAFEQATLHRKAHRSIFELAFLAPGGDTLFTVSPNDGGTLTRDRTRLVRAEGSWTCAGKPARIVPPGTDPRVVRPFGTEVRISRGFEYTDGSQELLTRAILRLTKTDPTTGLEGTQTAFTGEDRMERLDRESISELDILLGTRFDDAIIRLLQHTWQGAGEITSFPPLQITAPIDPDTGQIFQTPVLHFEAKSQGATEAAKLADSCGRQLFAAHDGAIALLPLPDRFGAPVWEFVDGQNDTRISIGQSWSSENTPNYWKVNGTGPDVAGLGASAIFGVAFVEDPSTSIDVNGRYGTVPRFIDSNRATSASMCVAEAEAEKTKTLAGTDTVEIETLPIGFLLEGDVINLQSERLDMENDHYVITSMSEPLDAEGTMLITAGRG